MGPLAITCAWQNLAHRIPNCAGQPRKRTCWRLSTFFPKGLDTPVGEGGAQLSGGQAQRLALARAFLRDAPVLVLDEPTAHLDVVQERLLQETSRRLCLGRTVLVIAHRLPTVAQADQIIVLDEGRVAECGQHTDLLAQGGRYTQMLSAYRGGAL